MIKLALSDMDNTLVPFGNPRASQRTIDAIHAVQEQGIDFGPASGRNRLEVSAFFGGDASCYNTAVLVNGQEVYFNGQLVRQVLVERGWLNAVQDIVLETPDTVLITYRPDGTADWVGTMERQRMEGMIASSFKGPDVRHDRLPVYPVTKAGLVHMGSLDALHDLQRRLSEAVPDCIFPNTVVHWLDMSPRSCSKAEGVAYLVHVLGLSLDEVAVFGDADNDLEMLRLVPHSCAVANANDNARAAARHHVPASADDGVAWALDQIAEAGRHFNETGEQVLPRFMAE